MKTRSQDATISHVKERRLDGLDFVKTFVMPAVLAAIGVYVGIQVAVAELVIEVGYIKRDLALESDSTKLAVKSQNALLEKIVDNQIKLTQLASLNENNAQLHESQKAELLRIKDRLRILEGIRL